MTPTFEELHHWFTPKREARFRASIKEQDDGCHVWTGTKTDSGHGVYKILGQYARVHRITWIMARERDIEPGLVVRHVMCTNKLCCNVAHLLAGDQGDNVRDEVFVHTAFDRAKEREAMTRYLATPYIGYLNDREDAPVCNCGHEECVEFYEKRVSLPIEKDALPSVPLCPDIIYDIETMSLQCNTNFIDNFVTPPYPA
jgi:hypothetical protein